MRVVLIDRRLTALIVAAIFALLAAPATSSAHATAHKRTPLSIALADAYHLWHVKPCDGHYKVVLYAGELPYTETGDPQSAAPSVEIAPTVKGEALWNSPAGEEEFGTPPSEWTGCTMVLLLSDWTARNLHNGGWAEACFTVLHEWGHLTGHPHSDEPGAPPEPAGTTAEQLAVMRSGNGNSYPEDPTRCGRGPYRHKLR